MPPILKAGQAVSAQAQPNSFRTGPDERGHFGQFGGRFVAETLMPNILELEKAYEEARNDPSFHADMASYSTHYIGRPSPLYFAERMTEHLRDVRRPPACRAERRSTSSARS